MNQIENNNNEQQPETKPRRTWLLLLIPALLIVAAAAFVGGRLLNGQGAALGLSPFGFGPGAGMQMSVSLSVLPAPELPTTLPETTGTFASRKDNSIFVQEFSMSDIGGGGGVVALSVDSAGAVSSEGAESGPKVEVLVTSSTKIYRDATDFGANPPQGDVSIQQVVEPGSLDDLKSMSMVTVWGRKNGDRIIADVISYSNPVMIDNNK